MTTRPRLIIEYLLLAFLAFLWGSSYVFTKIAVAEVPPITLIALRVGGAALFLFVVLLLRAQQMPRDIKVWTTFGLQAIFNSIGAWTVLA